MLLGSHIAIQIARYFTNIFTAECFDVFVVADTADCGYARPSVHQTIAITAAYVVTAICGVCLLIIFGTYLYRSFATRTCCHRHNSLSDGSSLVDRPQRR